MDGGVRPVPRIARERWLDSLFMAGWRATDDQGTDHRGTDDPGTDHPGTGGGRDSERVTVGEALGRVTTAPVVARWPSPRTDCAAMDGIAVRAADLAAARAVTVTEGQPGDDPADGQAVRLPAGLFEWIDTGDPMPASADTVIVRERLLPQADGSVVITARRGWARGRTANGPRGARAERAGGRRGLRRRAAPGARGPAAPPWRPGRRGGRRARDRDRGAATSGRDHPDR